MILHLEELNLSKDEKERVAELHQTYGFIVYNAGFSCTMEEGRKVEMCYWRCLRGVRESALFPTHEAAWRDALRVHGEAVDAVKANPGVHRVAQHPHSQELSVLKGQRNAKRAYGVPQGSLEEGQLRTLECVGYKFEFTSTWGWKCEQVPYVKGALVNCIKEAWQHAIAESNDEEGMLATAKAYMEGSNEWQGIGQPPPGTTLWVTPHNTLWGFNVVDVYLCEVMMYDGEHVWLKVLSDLGHDIGQYATTRIDKVDVKVWKGNRDA